MANQIKVKAIDITIGASASSIKAAAGGLQYAKEVILLADSANSANVLLGDTVSQLFPLVKTAAPLHLAPMTNRMSQSTSYDLSQMVLSGTSGDKVHVLLIDPSTDIP